MAQEPWTGWLPCLPASPRACGHIPPGQQPSTFFFVPPWSQANMRHAGRPECSTPRGGWCARHKLDLGQTLLCIHTCVHSCASTHLFTAVRPHKCSQKNKTSACKGNDEDVKSLYKGYIHSVMTKCACKGNMCWKHKSKRHCKHTLHLFSSHEQG